jgi:hypothetical protein
MFLKTQGMGEYTPLPPADTHVPLYIARVSSVRRGELKSDQNRPGHGTGTMCSLYQGLLIQSNLSTSTRLGAQKNWLFFRGGRYNRFDCTLKPFFNNNLLISSLLILFAFYFRGLFFFFYSFSVFKQQLRPALFTLAKKPIA